MPYSAKAVANHFLDLAEATGQTISPMKIQKLVYFAHGWHLAVLNAPLINEQVEAWKYGPVIRTLYHAFKGFGNQPIQGRATSYKLIQKPKLRIRVTTPKIPISDETEGTRDLLTKVWDVYARYSAVQLSNLTHSPGTPWRQVVDSYGGEPPKGTDIPTESIRKYFVSL
jgi:uncharacterized phage-associated protein